jgi:heptosyltransferase-2/heptosyltransferase-3
MDRDTLAERNRLLAEAYHAQSMRHKLRSRILRLAAMFPFAPVAPSSQRILIIRPDHIGDLLLTTPAIHALKQALPHAEVHVLAGPWAANLLQSSTDVDQVLTVRFPGFDRASTKQRPLQPYTLLLKTSRQLRAIGYSAAVVMRPDHWWGAFLAHAAGIRERIGYALPEVAPFLTRAIPFAPTHAVRQSLRLVEHITGTITDDAARLTLPVTLDDAQFVDDWLEALALPEKRLVCIHAGAGTWVKQWEAARWAQVADALSEHFDVHVIFTGTSSEKPIIEQVLGQARLRHTSAAGVMGLGSLAALYQRSALVIGCDSGPMHIAAAVDTPTVTLFGPANPAEFAPWGDRERHLLLMSSIACRPCRVLDWGDDPPAYHPCLRDITVHDVLATASRLLHA